MGFIILSYNSLLAVNSLLHEWMNWWREAVVFNNSLLCTVALRQKKSGGLFHLLPLFGKTEQPEKQ